VRPAPSVASGTQFHGTCDPPHRRDAHFRHFPDVAVGVALIQQLRDPPAVHHGLDFRRGAQVFEKFPDFRGRLQGQQRFGEGSRRRLHLGFLGLIVPFHDSRIPF
jgi:hypothetical protein